MVYRKTQSWNDIREFTTGIKCHICHSESMVKRGALAGIVEMGNMPVPANPVWWQMCKPCHDSGWSFKTHENGFIDYCLSQPWVRVSGTPITD